MTCPLLVRAPIVGTHQAHRCKVGHAVACLTLFAWCSNHYEACPDYGRHQEQKVKEKVDAK